MPLPDLNKTQMPNLENKQKRTTQEDIVKLRNTPKWKKLYEKNLQSMEAMEGTPKQRQQAYLKFIDKIASAPPVNQNNIMASFPTFANPNFKYTSDDE